MHESQRHQVSRRPRLLEAHRAALGASHDAVTVTVTAALRMQSKSRERNHTTEKQGVKSKRCVATPTLFKFLHK